MDIVIIVGTVSILAVLLVAASCKQAGRESRREEKEHPCAYCQRWGECNGVDETCPWLN